VTFRSRLRLAFVAIVLVPMLAFVFVVRREVGERLTAQYEQRVTSLVAVIEEDLARESDAIAATLAGLRDALRDDNQFRRSALPGPDSERRYLIDYAGDALRLTGLSMLQVQDGTGRILSSGHFRNEFDRLEPELPHLLAQTPEGTALVLARTPESPFLALARVDSLSMGGRRFTLVGGVSAERFLSGLAREGELEVSIVHPGGVVGSAAAAATWSDRPMAADILFEPMVRELGVPFIDTARGEIVPASIRVTHPMTGLQALLRSIDYWFLLAVVVTAVIALILATWLSARISRPLAELAQKTSKIDLDRLDIDFDRHRRDEVGALSRLLGAMTERLRAGAARIKEAERRATVGELARQVNHDIKNGLMPIRNVFRHLAEVARDDPAGLPEVFSERRGTLDSGIAYLETLASNYARLYPRFDRQPCDVNEVVRQVVTAARGSGQAELQIDLPEGAAVVLSDAVVLRRIFENLVDNAIDSLESQPGTVTVSTTIIDGEAEAPTIRTTVTDTGSGMNEEQLAKIFDDFFTTKEDGTGLGLSIVRRLVMDLSGSVRAESEPGKGSCFIVELPGQRRSDAGRAAGQDGGGEST
jgi:signal transduction histidine kinase